MSVDRCPSCAAAVPTGAPWCTLCWSRLHEPEPEPAPEPAAEPEPEPANASSPIPTADSMPAAAAAPAPAAARIGSAITSIGSATPAAPASPGEPAPGAVVATAPEPTWPCLACNITVPIDEDECPECGRRFLAEPLPGTSLLDRLPVVKDKKTYNVTVIIAGSLGLTLVFLALLAVLGLLFG